jgi:predicted permease
LSEYNVPVTGINEQIQNFHPHLLPEMDNPRKYIIEDFNILSLDTLLKLLIVAFVVGLIIYILNMNKTSSMQFPTFTDIMPTATPTLQSASLMTA